MVVSRGASHALQKLYPHPEDAAISSVETTAVEYRSPVSNQPVVPLTVESLGALPPLAQPENWRKRTLFLIVAWVVTALFFAGVMQYWVPVHPGVDQNGYLFGGRQLAQTGTMKFAPADPVTKQFDPHQFVGRMWVGTDYGKPTERFYPKYPIGLPLIVAIVLKLGGPNWGPWAVHLINPIAMSLAVFAAFLLIRTFCGSFLAVLGQLVFATSPVTMLLAIDPNSHATAAFCVTWGMVGLFAWWKRGHPVVAMFAGLLIGYATTIRYTEATLLLPVVLVVVFRIGIGLKAWRIPVTLAKLLWTIALRKTEAAKTHKAVLLALMSPVRDWIGGGLVLLGWLIPVAGLLIYNLVAMGTPTGYDPTNESKPGASFNFEHAADNWETTLRHLAINGLFFLFPIAVMGLAWMFAWRRKAALVMAAWIVPCLAAYTLYYWAPDPQVSVDFRTPANLGVNIGYLRFFTTILPALAACGMWAIGHLTTLMVRHTQHWTTRVAAHSAVPITVFLACAVHLHNNGRDMEAGQYQRLVMQTNVEQVLAKVPEGSAIFFHDHSLFHHLQFARNYYLYDTQTYRKNVIDNLMNNVDPDDPQGLDPGRSKSMYERLKGFSQSELDEQQRQAALACLETGHKVFVIESPVGKNRPKVPRPVNDVVRRLTNKPASDASPPMYADVISRWRHILVPQSVSEVRDEKPNQPRQRRNRIAPVTYETPWLVYEISKSPTTRPSPEMQAVLDYEAEQKAKADTATAERQAADKARREAEKKAREDEQKRQKEQQLAEQERVKKIQQQEQQLKDLESKIAQLHTAQDKAVADAASTTQQLADLKAQHAKADDAVKRAAADRQTLEAALAQQRQQQGELAKDLDARKQQVAAAQQSLADTEKKLATAKAELDRVKAEAEKAKADAERARQQAAQPTTAPTTRPSP